MKEDEVDDVPTMFRMLLEKGSNPNIGFKLEWGKKVHYDVSPLGFFAKALIHLEDWNDQPEYTVLTSDRILIL